MPRQAYISAFEGVKYPRRHEVTSVFRRVMPIRRGPRGRLQCQLLPRIIDVVERSSWLVQPAAASKTRRKRRVAQVGAVSGVAQSIRWLQRPAGLFWAGVGVEICDMAPHPLCRLDGRVATKAMISRAQVELGAGTRQKREATGMAA